LADGTRTMAALRLKKNVWTVKTHYNNHC
jgi:hypothetical protein